jgi:esterase/lipase superfamily enzyme
VLASPGSDASIIVVSVTNYFRLVALLTRLFVGWVRLSMAMWNKLSSSCVSVAGAALIVSLLAGCAATGISDMTSKVASIGDGFSSKTAADAHEMQVFVVSTRKGERGSATQAPSDGGARYSLQMVSVPPGHEAGVIERPSFGSENPARHFVVAGSRTLDEAAFQRELATHISGRIGSNRDVLLYVHGFNTSYDEARFRMAQIAEDGRFGGVPVLFTWPSSSSLLAYGSDKESATASRDSLERLLRLMSEAPGVGRIHILAHSMGTWLAMEALRERAIAGSPDLNGRLGDIMLAAPDIDLTVFRQQISRLDPSHVSIFVSAKDRALSVSRRLAGDRPRLGALDPRNPEDRAALEQLGVRVYDLSGESTGIVGHGTYANAPQVVRAIGAQLGEARTQDANVQSVLGDSPVSQKVTTEPLAPISSAPLNPPAPPLNSTPASKGAAAATPSGLPAAAQ